MLYILEGINGIGKTTMLKELKNEKIIDGVIKVGIDKVDKSSSFDYKCVNLVKNKINYYSKIINTAKTIVLDRGLLTTRVYSVVRNGRYREMPMDMLQLSGLGVDDRQFQYLLLTCSDTYIKDVIIPRIIDRGVEEKYQELNYDFMRRLRDCYEDYAPLFRAVVIDIEEHKDSLSVWETVLESRIF